MFTKEIKDKLIEDYYKEYDKRFIGKTKPQKNKPERMLGNNGLYYIQLTLHRSRALFEEFPIIIL